MLEAVLPLENLMVGQVKHFLLMETRAKVGRAHFPVFPFFDTFFRFSLKFSKLSESSCWKNEENFS